MKAAWYRKPNHEFLPLLGLAQRPEQARREPAEDMIGRLKLERI